MIRWRRWPHIGKYAGELRLGPWVVWIYDDCTSFYGRRVFGRYIARGYIGVYIRAGRWHVFGERWRSGGLWSWLRGYDIYHERYGRAH